MKVDKKNLKNYKSIILLSHIYKLFTKVVFNSLLPHKRPGALTFDIIAAGGA